MKEKDLSCFGLIYGFYSLIGAWKIGEKSKSEMDPEISCNYILLITNNSRN